jgi:uncharacterized protein (DUF1800 family)
LLFLRAAGPLALVLVSGAGASTSPQPKPAPLPADEAAIVHALNRIAFGPTAADMERVRTMGLARYLEQQLHPDTLDDAAMRTRLAPLTTLSLSARDIAQQYYVPLVQTRRELQRRAGATAANTDGAGAPADATGDMAPDRRPAQGSSDATPGAGEPQRRLANLTPEERRQAMTLRREEQKILAELGQQKILRAVYSTHQLEEVLVDFWFNHFNVFAGKGPVRVYLTEYEREAIRPHVLGNFRDLVGAVARSPAMLFYLDNWQSADPELAARVDRMAGAARRGPAGTSTGARAGQARRGNGAGRFRDMPDAEREQALTQLRQRMPRGLNENYARELLELHTLGVDGGYTQKDVVEVAKAFTGWTIRMPRAGGEFWFDERRHAKGPKHVLGATIDKGGRQDGEAVLDLLASHPSTATFIATKLARRFVADDPPVSVVARAAETFRKTKGDLRAVTRTIVTSPEFFAADARRAKVKTPFEFVVSALRASNAEITQAGALVRSLRELGMPLYFAQPPTGYADRADAWVNTGALLNRLNFAVSLVNDRLPGVRAELSPPGGDTSVDAARTRLVSAMLQVEPSAATKQTLARATEVAQVAALTLGSPEFQRR